MGELRFPFPNTIGEAVDLLNESPEHPSLTVMQGQDRLYVFAGDQPMFISQEPQEIRSFLAGLFLGTFHGMGIQQIRVELEQQNSPFNKELKEMRAELDDLRSRLTLHVNLEVVSDLP